MLYILGDSIQHCFAHFYAAVGTVRPNYLNYSNSYSFENRTTRSLTFKNVDHLEDKWRSTNIFFKKTVF